MPGLESGIDLTVEEVGNACVVELDGGDQTGLLDELNVLNQQPVFKRRNSRSCRGGRQNGDASLVARSSLRRTVGLEDAPHGRMGTFAVNNHVRGHRRCLGLTRLAESPGR